MSRCETHNTHYAIFSVSLLCVTFRFTHHLSKSCKHTGFHSHFRFYVYLWAYVWVCACACARMSAHFPFLLFFFHYILYLFTTAKCICMPITISIKLARKCGIFYTHSHSRFHTHVPYISTSLFPMPSNWYHIICVFWFLNGFSYNKRYISVRRERAYVFWFNSWKKRSFITLWTVTVILMELCRSAFEIENSNLLPFHHIKV